MFSLTRTKIRYYVKLSNNREEIVKFDNVMTHINFTF